MLANDVQEIFNRPQDIYATRIGRYLGAEVHGVELDKPLGAASFGRILDLLHEHCVVFLRAQSISAEQFARFSSCFGELDIHHMTEHLLPGLPEVRILSNAKKNGRAVGITRGGMHWHSDLSYQRVPAFATLLYGIECPPEGADTRFVNMYAAYEALPHAMRARLAGMRGVHDRAFRYRELYPDRPPLTPEQIAKVAPVDHPVVRRHPATGRPALYVAKDVVSHIVGIDRDESRRLIESLEEMATGPEFIYSHKWQPGDVLIWDNRCTLHRATPYDNKYTRTLYRTQIKGEVPIAA